MNRLHAMLRTRPGLVLGVLLCALFARVVVPAGFMPAQAATGLEICWGGNAPMLLDSANSGAGGDAHDRLHAPCSFASLTSTAVLPTASFAINAPPTRVPRLAAATVAPFATIDPHLRPPLRGPPLTT